MTSEQVRCLHKIRTTGQPEAFAFMSPVKSREDFWRAFLSFMDSESEEIEKLFGLLDEDCDFLPIYKTQLPPIRHARTPMTPDRTLEIGAIFERSATLHLPGGRRPTLSEYDNRRDSVVTDRLYFGVFPHE